MNVNADWAGQTIAWLENNKIKPRRLLDEIGIDHRDLNFGQQVPAQSFAAILDYGATMTGDKNFGLHRGSDFEISRGGVLAYLAASAETVGEALLRYQRYAEIVCDGFSLQLQPNGDSIRLLLMVSDPIWATCHHLGEFTASRTIGGLRKISGTDLSPLQVNFMHARVGAPAECRRFFRCNVCYGGDRDMLQLSSATLSIRIPTADSRLGHMLVSYADGLLRGAREKKPRSLKSRVVNVITQHLASGRVSLQDVARQMKVGERTLRRQLRMQNLKYADLLDEVRLNLSTRWLTQTAFDLKHISFLLGYSDPSVFSRAYKRWTGKTPGSTRLG